MPIILTGNARVMPHQTLSKKTVPQVHFTADQYFEVDDRIYHANHFEPSAPFGARLLDWNAHSKDITARGYEFQQPIRLSIEQKGQYWNILGLEVLGPCKFVPGVEVHHRSLKAYPHQELLPGQLLALLRENDEVLATKSGFAALGLLHGPWITSTGEPTDLVLTRQRKRVPCAPETQQEQATNQSCRL